MELPAILIALEGPSGAGKTTVARAVAGRTGAEFLPEAFALLSPAPSLEYSGPDELFELERILLVEERRRFRRALAARRRGRPVVADTGFFGPLTYTAGLVALGLAPRSVLVRLLREAGRRSREGPIGAPDLVVYLDVPESVLWRRAAHDPVGHPRGLFSRHLAVGRRERTFYRQALSRVLPDRVRVISAVGSSVAVAQRVVERARSISPVRSSRGVLERVMEAVRAVSEPGRDEQGTPSAATVKKATRSHRLSSGR